MIRRGLVATGACFVLALVASALAWGDIAPEEQIAVHWNLKGEADRYAGKTEAMFLLPAMIAGLGAMFAMLPRIDPRRRHIERSPGAFLIGWIGASVLLLGVHTVVLYGAIAGDLPRRALVVASAVLVLLIGNAIAKSRSNGLVGVRTPWSLSNEDAWIASNRAAGWGFVVTGILSVLAVIGASEAAGILTLVGGALASAAIGIGVSYTVWRRAAAEPTNH